MLKNSFNYLVFIFKDNILIKYVFRSNHIIILVLKEKDICPLSYPFLIDIYGCKCLIF